MKPKVFDSILAHLSFLLGNLISCLPQKGEKEVSSFHTILLSWSSQQKIPEERSRNVAGGSDREREGTKAFRKQVY
jgi:hypothetical protein